MERISQEERIKCKRVADAFSELCDLYGDMAIADAGDFGFVHLKWFDGEMFSSNNVITDSKELFEELWQYWVEYHLLEPVKGTPLAELSYCDLFELLTEEKKKTFFKKKEELWLLAFKDIEGLEKCVY